MIVTGHTFGQFALCSEEHGLTHALPGVVAPLPTLAVVLAREETVAHRKRLS